MVFLQFRKTPFSKFHTRPFINNPCLYVFPTP
nr:MAG TPA: hypothetical protein [Caudoviricetes sp.]